ncbi:MAG: VanZ family protein [Lachnospiraceae bacterium]|nr:VanZ family protein [Lachnospiraceae bacterium]
MIILNLLLFVPLGFLLPIVFPGFVKSGKKVFLAGLMFSVGIELTQLFSGRMFELDDIIANSLGALLGYLIFLLICDMGRLLSMKNGMQYGMKAEVKTEAETKRALRRILLTIFTYGIGLFMISLVADGEKKQWQEERKYPGIDGDQTAMEDICRMRMISEKGIYEEDGIRNSDFDMAFRWMASGIDSHMSFTVWKMISSIPRICLMKSIWNQFILISGMGRHMIGLMSI